MKTKINTVALLQEIPVGKNKAVRKIRLCNMFNLRSDRAIRNAVEELRQEGNPIATDTQTGGYYIPATREEAADYLLMELARMKTVIKNIKNLYKIFNEKYNDLQLKLDLEV